MLTIGQLILFLIITILLLLWAISKRYLKSSIFGTLCILLAFLLGFVILGLIGNYELLMSNKYYANQDPLVVLSMPDYVHFNAQVKLIINFVEKPELTQEEYIILRKWVNYMLLCEHLTAEQTNTVLYVKYWLDVLKTQGHFLS